MSKEYHMRPRDAAVEVIECYIAENDLKPHDRLPSERDMCEMWGFNRTTLRNAIHSLIMHDIIYNKKGSGTFVSPPKMLRDLQEVKGFTEAARECGFEPSVSVISKKVIESTKRVSRALQLVLGSPVLEIIRLRRLDGIPVMIENSYLDISRLPGIEKQDFNRPLYGILREEYNLRLTHGHERLNITYVDADEAALLELDEGAAVIYQHGVVNDDKDQPVEYFRSIVNSRYLRYTSNLRR